MKQLPFDEAWPASWQHAYLCDAAELWGSGVNLAYTYYYQARYLSVIRAICDSLQPGAELLDLAAAQGNFSLTLAEHGFRVTWNDLRDELEGYVRLKYETGSIRYAPGNAFEVSQFAQPQGFDGVIAAEVLEHVAHPDAFLASVLQLVAPGGFLFLSTPNGEYLHTGLPRFSDVTDRTALEAAQFQPGSEGHLFLFTNRELQTLAEDAGFRVVSIQNLITPVLAGEFGLGKFFRFLPRGFVAGCDRALAWLSFWWRRRVMLHTTAVFQRPNDLAIAAT